MPIVHGKDLQVRWVRAIVLIVRVLLGCYDPPIYCLDSIDSGEMNRHGEDDAS